MSQNETKQNIIKTSFLQLVKELDANIFICILKYITWIEWQKLCTTNHLLNNFIKNKENYNMIRKVLNMPIINCTNLSKYINMFDESKNKADQIKRKSFAIQIDNRHIISNTRKNSFNIVVDASGSTKTFEGSKSRYEWFCDAIKNIPFENIKNLNKIQITFFDDTIQKQYIFSLDEFNSYKQEEDNELSGQNPFGGGTILYHTINITEQNLLTYASNDRIISLILTDGETSEGYNNGFSFLSYGNNSLQQSQKYLYNRSCTRIFVGVGTLDKKVGNCGSAVFIPSGDKLNMFINTIINLANKVTITQLKIQIDDSILQNKFFHEYCDEKKICDVIDNIPTKKLPCLEEGTISTNCFTLQLNEEFQILNPKEKFELLNALRQKKIFYFKKYDNENFWNKLKNIKICKDIKKEKIINFKISYFVNGYKYNEILSHKLNFNFSCKDNPLTSNIPESEIINAIQNELLKTGNMNEIIEFGMQQDQSSQAYQMSQALHQTPSNLRQSSAAAFQAAAGMPSLQRQTSQATQAEDNYSDSDDDNFNTPMVNRFSTAPTSNSLGITFGAAAQVLAGHDRIIDSLRQSTSIPPGAPRLNRSLAQDFSDDDDDDDDYQVLFGNTNRNLFHNENDLEQQRIENNRMEFDCLPKAVGSKRTRALDLAGDNENTRPKKKKRNKSNEV